MTKMAQCLSHQASTSSDEHRAIILADDSFSSSTQPEDSIEFISQVILADDLQKEPLRQSRKYEKPRAEPENRKVSRCVALIAFLLLAVCFALMGVSFTLTSKIDEMETTPSTLDSSSTKRVDASELRRRRIARIVGAVAIFFIVFSCVLLGISFNMSDDINDKVRNSNSVLRKHNMPMNPQEHVTNESYFN